MSGPAHRAALLCALLPAATGCDRIACEGDPGSIVRPAHWAVHSHCPGVEPDYETVFDETLVHRFDITVSSQDHSATMDDMDEKYSGGGTAGDLDDSPRPMWVPATVRHDGSKWTSVGMRYKGHSSLKAAWQSGVRKLAFILDFDHYEDSDRDLKDQRFFGFNRLSFSNAFNDPSLMRDKLAADIFRAAGVPAARSAFAAVHLDWGEGSVFLGLYTMIEDPCDVMLKQQIGAGGGNLYKPWGDAARWLDPSTIGPDEIAAHFETCSDDAVTDRSDIVAAIGALHGDRSDPAAWRAGLEQVLDVRSFIRTLAVNQVMMNWDSYGCMHHNYFVYANPADGGRFVWFPWDLNESMLDRRQTGCPEPGSVLLDEIVTPDATSGIDADWPLIQLLLADAVYRAAYLEEVRAAVQGAFAEQAVVARMETYHALIAPYVVGPTATEKYPYTNCTRESFLGSLTTGESALKPHVTARHAAVKAALGM